MSSGDPAARVVVDLASFQPLENGLSNQSIYSVRLQQMCPAKKRRRFLRRGNARPPGSPATNHIRKDAILVIGVDRLIIGVVEEEVKPIVDKTAEKSAAKAMREEEKAASRALKQEERAAARAHRDATRAAARADKSAHSGSGRRLGVLRMRRASSGPDIGGLADRAMAEAGGEASSPDREPSLGSASPSLSVSPDVHPPARRVLQHGRSHSQHLPDMLPASDGEIDDGAFRRPKIGAAPPASSPLRISHSNTGANGHVSRSPFAQDDMALPTTPQQTPPDWPGLARFSGVDVEQHTFSADVAFSQVVRIEREAEEVTVFYRPNSLGVEELSRNPVANALAVTFLLSTETAAMELVTEVERAVERYCQGMGHLGRQLPLPGPPQMLLVTHRRAGAAAPEAVVQGQPSWGSTVPAPASWDAASLTSPEDASSVGGEDVVVVYVTTPLGSGTAQISLPVVRHFLQGEEAHLFVGVALRPPPRSVERRTSLLVRRSIMPGSAEEAAEAAGSAGDWQPADSILEVEPSPASTASTPDSTGDSFTSRANGGGSAKTLERRSKMRKCKQVRLHCVAACAPRRSGFRSPGWPRSNGHPHSPNGLLPGPPGSGAQGPSALLTAAGFSAPAVPLLLQGHWLLLLQWALVALIVAACWHPQAALRILTFLADCAQILLKGESLPEPPRLRASAAAAAQPVQVAPQETGTLGAVSGKWRLTLLRAEIVDDYWCAAGPSLDADMGTAERAAPAEPKSKLDALTSAHGVSRDVAQRYLMAANDELAATHRLLQTSREWREVKLGVKNILQQPQPHYEAFKSLFSHGVLGFSHSGRPIWVMRIGEIKKGLKALKATGVTSEDYERHVMFVQDYMYEVLDPNLLPEGRSIWIIDMKGVGLTDMGSEAMDYVKTFASIVAANYPERLYRNFVVNAPGFFSLVWRIAEPMLSPSTRKKIRLLHNKQDTLTELREEMDEELIPHAYGGLNTLPLYQSKPEVELRQLVERLNQP